MIRTLLASIAIGGVIAAGAAVPALADVPTPTTFFVDCSQKVAGDGSSATPWNSIASVNDHGQFSPGDTILFRRATTCSGRLDLTGDGTASARITVGAYGHGARPTIRGGGTADGTAAIQIGGWSYWTVQDLHVTNTVGGRSSSRYRSGVMIRNTSSRNVQGITVRRLLVEDVASNMSTDRSNPREWGGIVVVADQNGSGRFSGVTISDNVVRDVGRTGIIVTNHNYPRAANSAVRISGNRVSNTRGDGIVDLGSIGTRIDHNVVANAASLWPCPECHGISPATADAGIYTLKSRNALIDHNEVYGTHVLGGDGEGLDVDISAVSAVIEYNYAHDNEGGGILFCGSTGAVARFNIFQNNAKSAIAFIGSWPARNTQIYNNTIYGSGRTNASVVRYFNGAHGSGISFRNNLVFSYGKGYYGWPTSVSSASNTYVGSHRQFEPDGGDWSWNDPGLKNPGSGRNGMNTLGGYRPAHPSWMQRGVAIPRDVTVDFFGKRIDPKHPPRGAAG